METDAIQQLIEAGLPGCRVQVSGDGSHFEAIVVGEIFAGKTPLQKQKMVYATVNEQIISGAIHALSIKAYTPDAWQQAQKLRVGGLG
jgi:acid stress-induced BolA-like protein IbaG/YrbA